jgi:hypothetical protein
LVPPRGAPPPSSVVVTPAAVARDAGTEDDPRIRDLIGEARVLDVVGRKLQQRVGVGVRTGYLSDQGAAVARLFIGTSSARTRTIGFEIAASAGGAWLEDEGALAGRGTEFLVRQASCIGGGTTEMARNVISERVLGMPRERSVDKDIPFRDVPRSSGGSR